VRQHEERAPRQSAFNIVLEQRLFNEIGGESRHMDENVAALQSLHDAKINWSIAAFHGSVFYWTLGDNTNNWIVEGKATSLVGAVVALKDAAIRSFPHIDIT
jgi:hypothetical protein